MADEVIVVFGAETKSFNDEVSQAIKVTEKLDDTAEKTAKDISANFANAGKKMQAAFAGKEVQNSLKATAKTADELRAAIDKLQKEEVKLLQTSKNVATDGVQAIRKQADELRKALGILGTDVNKTGTALESAAKRGTTLSGELRKIKNEISTLEQAGKGGTKAFTDLTIQAAKLEDQIGDTRERVRVLASDTFKFDAAVQGVQAVAGAFAGVQGAIALFGEESEEVNKALVKVQGSLALVAAAQEFANLVTGQGALKIAIQTNLLKVQTFVTQGATVATKAWRAALVATGIGAVIAVIATLVSKLGESKEQFKESAEAAKAYQNAIDDLNRGVVASQIKLADEQIKKLQLTGKISEETAQKLIAANKVRGEIAKINLDAQNKENEAIKRNEEARLEDIKLFGRVAKSTEDQLGKDLTAIEQERANNERAINLAAENQKLEDKKKVSKKVVEIKEKENIDLQKLLDEEIQAQLRTQAIIAETATVENDSIANQIELIIAKRDADVNAVNDAAKNEEEKVAERNLIIAKATAEITALRLQANQEVEDDEEQKLKTSAKKGISEASN